MMLRLDSLEWINRFERETNMKSVIARFNLIVGLSALGLLTLCLVQLAVRAHEPKPESTFLRATTTGANPTVIADHRDGPLFPPSGLSARLEPRQTLSVKLTNLIKVKGEDPVAIFARVRLSDPQGGLITQSEEVKIPVRGSYSFTFKRAALRFPGERGTGRLPMLVNGWVRYEYRSHDRDSEDAYPFIRDARASGLLPVLVQLINESNGRTITLYQDAQKKTNLAPKPEKGLRDKPAPSQGNRPQGWFSEGPSPVNSSEPTNKIAKMAKPDLRIKQFLFPPTNDKALRVQVSNDGSAASGASRLNITVRKINGTAVGRQTHVNIPALAPGKKVWLVIDAKSILPVNVSLKSTTFKLNADATGIVAESDETNNEVWHNL